MWFSQWSYSTLPQTGVPLLGITCLALVSALHVGTLRGAAPWWLRYGLVAAMVALLFHIDAGDLLVFVAAHFVACFPLAIAVSHQRHSTFRLEAILIAGILLAEILAVMYLRPTLLYPERFLVYGLCTGWAAVLIEFGMRSRRYWFLTALVAGGLSIGLDYLVADLLGDVDLWGIYLRSGYRSPNRWLLSGRSYNMLEFSTLLYWLWRLALRLAVVEPSPASLHQPVGEIRSFRSSDLGHGKRRWLRLLLVWPALVALTVIIFTPWLEAYWRMPGPAQIPPAPTGPNAWDQLIAYPQSLDWSMLTDLHAKPLPSAPCQQFYEVNHEKLSGLQTILAQPLQPPVDYSPKAAFPATDAEEESLDRLIVSLRAMHAGALLKGDAAGQFLLAQTTLQLAGPFSRNGVSPSFGYSQFFKTSGMLMAYDFREHLNKEQLEALIELVRSSAEAENSEEIEFRRTLNWLLAIRGWREQVHRACYALRSFTTSFPERKYLARRNAFVCELALRQYALDHNQNYPATLESLVPEYLDAIPRDPFSTGPLRYRNSDASDPAVLVYSVGLNERDDGGLPYVPGVDVGADDISMLGVQKDLEDEF